jgi:hypothetical protein
MITTALSIVRQWLDKNLSAVTDKHATMTELLGAVFPARFVPRHYSEDYRDRQSVKT